MGSHHLKMFRVHLVVLGACITSERICIKIVLGQTKIGFIGSFIRILEFHFKLLPQRSFGIGIDFEFGHEVILIKTGIIPIFKIFESVGIVIEVFHSITKIFLGIPQLRMNTATLETSVATV